MNKHAARRMFRAAIVSALETMDKDPATMAAIDLLAEPFQHGIDGMLRYLWLFSDDALQPGGLLGLEYSRKRQDAVLLITAKSYQDWIAL